MGYGELLAQLVGRSIDDASIDEESGELRCKLSDGSLLDIKPATVETEDPPYWELIQPCGCRPRVRPRGRWQISSADASGIASLSTESAFQ
jgi:hypothetical protein